MVTALRPALTVLVPDADSTRRRTLGPGGRARKRASNLGSPPPLLGAIGLDRVRSPSRPVHHPRSMLVRRPSMASAWIFHDREEYPPERTIAMGIPRSRTSVATSRSLTHAWLRRPVLMAGVQELQPRP